MSVVIPSRDKRALLARTLDALRTQQPGPEDWEIVVVNDGSTDDTGAFLTELASVEPRLKVVTPPANVGRAAARNLGWRAAAGRWIVFLDDDIVAPPGLLRAHLDILAADPTNGTIGPALTDPAIIDAPHFFYLDTRGVAKLPGGPAPGKYFVTQNAGVLREALARIGGFDEDFSAYGFEDMDLGFRLEDAGVRFQVLEAPVPCHIHHHTLADYLDKKRICGRSSLRQVAQRHPERLAEMRLDLVVDPEGQEPSAGQRLVRGVLTSPLGGLAEQMARVWPNRGHRPVLAALYCRCLDVAVLSAYCRGLTETAACSVKSAE
ncbi:MAG: glycosyltransferase [Gammaproteobacteria bacterium]|nr:glycosyltransferase [Gammaproteobacteria bacterium]